jgi:hypothetical protein
MAVYKLKKFVKWQLDYDVSNTQLLDTIKEIDEAPKKGNIGKFLYKKRIGLEGIGKSGGHRVIVAAKLHENYFFMYGFQKNEKDNLDIKETKIFKELAKDYISYTNEQLQFAVQYKELEILQEK